MIELNDDGYKFDDTIICPTDISATPQRIAQYRDYYRVKYAIAKAIQPKTIIEIGVRAGYSAWAFLTACPKATYYGFDAENGNHGGNGGPYSWWAQRILSERGFRFKVFAPYDTQCHGKLPKSADFYHVDGDHTTDGVYHDMKICFDDMDVGSYMLIDDYNYVEAAAVRVGVDRWLDKHHHYVSWSHYPSLRGEVLVRKEKEMD